MKIRAFGAFIEKENLEEHVLQNSTVVVDAQNFFYGMYQKSGLEYIFGCDSDKYAKYLKNYLSMFKQANVKCYFIFKGGHENYANKLQIFEEPRENFQIDETYDDIVLPIFMKDVYKQVLDEMDFDYTICEFEAKKECIALAQKLKCPIISQDIEFCFSKVPYIMQSSLNFDQQNRSIKCGIFKLNHFLTNNSLKVHLTEEKLALFATLTDKTIFPSDHFLNFIRRLRIPINHYKRNKGILTWLAGTSKQHALVQIFRYINEEDQATFLEAERTCQNMIQRQETPGIPSQYLENDNTIEVTEKDQFWLEKGVASKQIAIQWINLAHSGIVEGTWAIADNTQNDARLLSMDILKYAYNLLTNFEKEQLIFTSYDNQKVPVPLKNSVSKPNYDAINSPFENGWKNLKGDMFKHFLNESLQGFDIQMLGMLSEELRMLMIALIYFSVYKKVCTRNEVCSILLSYVALSEEVDRNNNLGENMLAEDVLRIYFNVSKMEAKRIFDVRLLHPLVEFQHCLQSLNYLNILCGKLYKPTDYSKTYNATFVYKVLHTINTNFNGNCMDFLKQELNTAPNMQSCIENLMNVYDEIMDSIE